MTILGASAAIIGRARKEVTARVMMIENFI
jgi:hypothetical protein